MLKRAKTKLRNRNNAARRWLELSKAYRMGKLSETEALEAAKKISTRKQSPADELVKRD